MSVSLTGKAYCPGIQLNGKSNNNQIAMQKQIKALKISIMNEFILPSMSGQWETLHNNLHLVKKYYRKLNYYYDLYKIEELSVYTDMLQLLEALASSQTLLASYDSSYSSNDMKTEMIQTVFKTSAIKLRPEFEIYNSIFGRPDKALDQVYNIKVINEIQSMLEQNDMTYDKIKLHIETYYDLKMLY
mgnify:CR=1 FL=1|jgi:hypothetical protein|tara:strand:+ start:7992 stop:8552 length:561 start_codon:yes stop_codon:yes gene_type:complete